MAYNIKIIEYENGQIEILHYAQGVRTRIDGETAYIDDVLSAMIRFIRIMRNMYIIRLQKKCNAMYQRVKHFMKCVKKSFVDVIL